MSGVHGVVKRLDDDTLGAGETTVADFFDQERARPVAGHARSRPLGYLDGVFDRLFDWCPGTRG